MLSPAFVPTVLSKNRLSASRPWKLRPTGLEGSSFQCSNFSCHPRNRVMVLTKCVLGRDSFHRRELRDGFLDRVEFGRSKIKYKFNFSVFSDSMGSANQSNWRFMEGPSKTFRRVGVSQENENCFLFFLFFFKTILVFQFQFQFFIQGIYKLKTKKLVKYLEQNVELLLLPFQISINIFGKLRSRKNWTSKGQQRTKLGV